MSDKKKKTYKTRFHEIASNIKDQNGKKLTLDRIADDLSKEGIGRDTFRQEYYGYRPMQYDHAKVYAEYLSQFIEDGISGIYLMGFEDIKDKDLKVSFDYDTAIDSDRIRKLLDLIEEYTGSKILFRFVFLSFTNKHKNIMAEYTRKDYERIIENGSADEHIIENMKRQLRDGIDDDALYCEITFDNILKLNLGSPYCQIFGCGEISRILITGVHFLGTYLTYGQFVNIIESLYMDLLSVLSRIATKKNLLSIMSHRDQHIKRVRDGLNKLDPNDPNYKDKLADLTMDSIKYDKMDK